jgi:site-specific recombinase XerD
MVKTESVQAPSFAALVQAFFAEHLQQQRAMSPRTVAAYRDAFVLFLDFAQARLHKQPTAIRLEEITPALILAFLDHLERERGNTVRSRNARLAALRAFLKFAGPRDVSALHAVEKSLGVPMKRFERPMLGFLSREEMLAIISEPDDSWTSQRDHLLLRMLYNTGARVSEIIGVTLADVVLDGAAYVHLHGKGRKQRTVPLWRSTVRQIRAWLRHQSAVATHIATVAQPRWSGDDAWERHSAPRSRRQGRDRSAAAACDAPHLPAHHPPHDGHAPLAGRRGHQRHRAVAGTREPDDNSPIRRG